MNNFKKLIEAAFRGPYLGPSAGHTKGAIQVTWSKGKDVGTDSYATENEAKKAVKALKQNGWKIKAVIDADGKDRTKSFGG